MSTSKSETTERRRLQRIHLLEPLPGKIRGKKVHVLDVSLRGARVAHQESLGPVGEECELSFEWNGQVITLDCRIRRSAVQRIGSASYARTLYHSGLEVLPSGRSMEALRKVIESFVALALDEQKANARGVTATPAAASGAASIALAKHELVNGLWKSIPTQDLAQPQSGFTIAANHSPVEVQMLRRAYVQGDEAARDAIRKIAALSLSHPDEGFRRGYAP